jgi:hypothetical protein
VTGPTPFELNCIILDIALRNYPGVSEIGRPRRVQQGGETHVEVALRQRPNAELVNITLSFTLDDA